jgi:hypothetical protein
MHGHTKEEIMRGSYEDFGDENSVVYKKSVIEREKEENESKKNSSKNNNSDNSNFLNKMLPISSKFSSLLDSLSTTSSSGGSTRKLTGKNKVKVDHRKVFHYCFYCYFYYYKALDIGGRCYVG